MLQYAQGRPPVPADLPPHDVAHRGPRHDAYAVKIDVPLVGLLARHVGAGPPLGLQPPAQQPPEQPPGQQTLRVQQAAAEAQVRRADEPPGTHEGEGAQGTGGVGGEGGGQGAAEGEANEVEGLVAGPGERGGQEGEEELARVETVVVGEVRWRIGVSAAEEV